jgi:hypothetical protein
LKAVGKPGGDDRLILTLPATVVDGKPVLKPKALKRIRMRRFSPMSLKGF